MCSVPCIPLASNSDLVKDKNVQVLSSRHSIDVYVVVLLQFELCWLHSVRFLLLSASTCRKLNDEEERESPPVPISTSVL